MVSDVTAHTIDSASETKYDTGRIILLKNEDGTLIEGSIDV